MMKNNKEVRRKKLLLKIVTDQWGFASRDQRELLLVKELGAEVIIMAKGERHNTTYINNMKVIQLSTRPLGTKVPNVINRIVSIFYWAKYARSLKPDIISGHDIIALFIGYLSTFFSIKVNKTILVYDSHEFEVGRNTTRSKLATALILFLEKFLIHKSAFTIVVNDSIADEIQRIYKLKVRPIVVRNIPPYWELNNYEIALIRKEICNELKVSTNVFILMYHGVVTSNRGIENILYALRDTIDTVAIILGNGSENYLTSLKDLAEEVGVMSRVLFIPAVESNELYKYIGAADVGMIIIPSVFKSYYMMLPNKLFENIQALTPVIVSDFPEITKITRKYKIGLEANPNNLNDIVAAINKMHTENNFYNLCKTNLIKAKQDLCWENEKSILAVAYKHII